MKWYVWDMDEGIIGEYRTKYEAMIMNGASRCRRIEAGNYITNPDHEEGITFR